MTVDFVEPKLRAHGTVRVKLPAKVAYDPSALKKSIGELMERLGCPKCFSGANCFFTHEREFIYEAKSLAAGPLPEGRPVARLRPAAGRGPDHRSTRR